LIDNALKYSAAPSEVRVSARAEGPWAQIEVLDAGIGLDPTQTDRFRAFGRGANVEQVQGLGLGLFISRQIVDRHGGTIEVLPRPDGCPGTVARVRLPMEQPTT